MTGHSHDPALTGIRVLDLGVWRPVPYAGQLLAEMGADVLKVEPPGGDPLRSFPDLYASLNARKRIIEVDLKKPAGPARVLELAAEADVLIEGFRPGVLGPILRSSTAPSQASDPMGLWRRRPATTSTTRRGQASSASAHPKCSGPGCPLRTSPPAFTRPSQSALPSTPGRGTEPATGSRWRLRTSSRRGWLQGRGSERPRCRTARCATRPTEPSHVQTAGGSRSGC
ncbi:MAG: hypothetical protein DYH08_10400 [Actinobacteria bacterium ATB1]|nr:hypothetical protein [Actinobacteria bacterium ATB1]